MQHDPGAPRIIVAAGMSGTGVSAVAACLHDAAPGMNIIDAGSMWVNIDEACAPGFTRMIVVTTHDIIAITSSYALIKMVRDHFTDAPLEVLVNASEEREALKTYERIQVACSHFLGETVGFAGSVPHDPMNEGPEEKWATHAARSGLGASAIMALHNLATRLDEELGATMLRGSWRHGDRRSAL
ncbi:MAG: hypothetical protein ABI338_02850 [Gemmatimonadaceae bacterium]